MYAAVREYKLKPGKIDEIVGRVRDEFIPLITNAPGFVAYTFVQVSTHEIFTASIFENQAGAVASMMIAASWVNDKLGGDVTGPLRVTMGEVTVRQVKEGAKAGYGVMRRFEIKPGNAVEISKRVRDYLVPQLSSMPGFASYALLMESTQDRGVSLSALDDRQSAEAANQHALAWLKDNVGDLLTKPVEIIAGDIKLRHARAAASAR
jgi:heme-degrading monooxygenase HmoA